MTSKGVSKDSTQWLHVRSHLAMKKLYIVFSSLKGENGYKINDIAFFFKLFPFILNI